MVKLEEEIRQEVMNEIDLSYDVSDEEILELIKNKIIEKKLDTTEQLNNNNPPPGGPALLSGRQASGLDLNLCRPPWPGPAVSYQLWPLYWVKCPQRGPGWAALLTVTPLALSHVRGGAG